MSRRRVNNSATPSMTGPSESTTSQTLIPDADRHLQTLSQHRHFYEFYMRTGEIVNFHHHIQNEILAAFHALYDPYYHYSRSCPVCVAEFLTRVYRTHDSNNNRNL